MAMTRRHMLAGLALCPLCVRAARGESGAHWSYEGHGSPKEWGELSSEFKACAIGAQQSPINLEGAIATAQKPLALNWTPQPYMVVNNGHTIQANALSPANTLSLDGETFELKQFHFHAPSEHAINGERMAMEAHFVHANDKGTLAVVGVLMKAGAANDPFSAIMAVAPKTKGEAALEAPLDINVFLPENRALYRYEGSLTTPPCSEIVDWNVFATPIEVAEADIQAFRAIFPMNARPLQAVNRRFLLQLQ